MPALISLGSIPSFRYGKGKTVEVYQQASQSQAGLLSLGRNHNRQLLWQYFTSQIGTLDQITSILLNRTS